MTTSISTFRSALLAAALVFAPFAVMHAQRAQPIRVNVPFDFQNGSATLPAGIYTLTQIGDHILSIHGENAAGQFMINDDATAGRTVAGSGKVVFQRYGNKYFLREVWKAGESAHVVFVPTPAENDARKAARTQLAAATQPAGTIEVALISSTR